MNKLLKFNYNTVIMLQPTQGRPAVVPGHCHSEQHAPFSLQPSQGNTFLDILIVVADFSRLALRAAHRPGRKAEACRKALEKQASSNAFSQLHLQRRLPLTTKAM